VIQQLDLTPAVGVHKARFDDILPLYGGVRALKGEGLRICKLIAAEQYMSKKIEAPPRDPRKRRIVGFSLPPALATEVKVEAAKRNLTLRKLFDEMWALYKTKKTA
jgi:hypothetical protein